MANVIAEGTVGKRVLLMGNEAIARGAIEAGIDVMAAYPGTPSSEIAEALADVAEELGFTLSGAQMRKSHSKLLQVLL